MAPLKEIAPAEQIPVAQSSAVAAPVASVVSAPNVVEAPFTPFWPLWLKQNPERVAAPVSNTLAMPDRQPQPESLAAVAETRLSDYPPPAPDMMAKTRTLPVSPRRASQPTPVRESEISQPAARETKAPSTAKPDMPAAPHVAVRQVEGSVTALEAPARVLQGTSPDIRIGRSAVLGSSAPKVMPEPETKVVIAPPPTRQISLKLSGDDSTRVNIDLTERAGKVQVSVRTPDHELAKSLQTDLGDLVGRLESKGFKTETWVPAAAHNVASAPQSSNSSTTPHGQPEYSGSWSGGGGRQSQNGSNQRRQSHWAAELDETVSASQARSENE